MNKGKQSGITLIALIITIIVILILVAVTVSTVANSGLFDHAKDATRQWSYEQERESNIGDDVDKLIDEHVRDDSYYVLQEERLVGLITKENEKATTFEKAYIEYNDVRIDITTLIQKNVEMNCCFLSAVDIPYFLNDEGITNDYYDVSRLETTIIIVKNNISYTGKILLICEV